MPETETKLEDEVLSLQVTVTSLSKNPLLPTAARAALLQACQVIALLANEVLAQRAQLARCAGCGVR